MRGTGGRGDGGTGGRMWKKQERGNREPWWARSEEPSEARGEGSNTPPCEPGRRVKRKDTKEMNAMREARKESKVIGERVWEGTSEEQEKATWGMDQKVAGPGKIDVPNEVNQGGRRGEVDELNESKERAVNARAEAGGGGRGEESCSGLRAWRVQAGGALGVRETDEWGFSREGEACARAGVSSWEDCESTMGAR
ncbi:hypothetical protein B0H14DRAFT_2584837 [Mycena olivaceomarginata]|nr:hypothetical protein B0H14DRAFT_2584837 [Mycena olivaceomarginata]